MEAPKDPKENNSPDLAEGSPEEVAADTSGAITSAITVDEDRQSEIIPGDNISKLKISHYDNRTAL